MLLASLGASQGSPSDVCQSILMKNRCDRMLVIALKNEDKLLDIFALKSVIPFIIELYLERFCKSLKHFFASCRRMKKALECIA